MKAPLGTVLGESRKAENVLVDRAETIELPLAHMIPNVFQIFCSPLQYSFIWSVLIGGAIYADYRSDFCRLCDDDENFLISNTPTIWNLTIASMA